MGSARPGHRSPATRCLVLWAVLAFAMGNFFTAQMIAVSEATSRIEVVHPPGQQVDPASVARATRLRRTIPFLILNSTIAGGVLLAFVARRLEARRRERLGLPPGLDEQLVRVPSLPPRREISWSRTRGYSWLDRKHRFDIN